MKKLICMLLVLIVLMLPLSGCKSGEEAESKVEENKLERYFLYVENSVLKVLDTKTESSKEIGLSFSVDHISNALVCEDSDLMVASVTKVGNGSEGLMVWDGKSADGVYLGDDTELARASRDGKVLVYVKKNYESNDLYRYDTDKEKETLLLENVKSVSVSENGNDIFATELKKDENESIYDVLYYITKSGEKTKIAETVSGTTNVSSDGSVVAYLKASERNELLYQSYIWTKGQGEKELPFEASYLQVFSKDEIYFQQMQWDELDGIYAKQCYYDGKKVHTLAEHGQTHGHKVGENLFYYMAENDEGEAKFYVAYKGESIETKIRFCPQKALLAMISLDEKSMYGWDANHMMYRVELKGDKLTETELRQTDGYSPRRCQFRGETLLHPWNDALYMNDKKITADWSDENLSLTGETLVYTEDGKLNVYTNGKTTTHRIDEEITYCSVAWEGKVLVETEDGVLLCKGSGEQTQQVTICEDAVSLVTVYPWSYMELTYIPVQAERTGGWFQRDVGTLVWRW